MIPVSLLFDQSTLSLLLEHDPVVQRSRAFFALFDWSSVPERDATRTWPGPPPHPQSAYVKALLVKLYEHHEYITQVRTFLLEHPLLVLELGFRPVLDATEPYGFDVERTVPCDRRLRHLQQTLDHRILQDLLHATVHALQAEIPGLGETIAVDVKHIYAWVQENNLQASVKERYDKERHPKGDPDCRLGVKCSTNLLQPDGTSKEQKKYVWGYGSGVVSAITADYGDVVLAEYTQPFNENDVTYYLPLSIQTVATLGFFPTYVTADAAFDAWYVYQTCVHHGGIAAVPLNQHGHPVFSRDTDGIPLCPKGLRMHPTYQFQHTNGYRAQRYRCPLLHPQPTGQSCDHEQFAKGPGCVKDINSELGGQMRVTLDRTAPLYKAIYRQRTSPERINSQALALGIERPKVRKSRSVENLNTLTYLVINAKALQRARSRNASLLSPIRLRE
jgi:Transposase DDE domain